MPEILLTLNSNGRGSFYIEEGEEVVARMNIGISDEKLIVYHTEVSEDLRGQNLGMKLLEKMVAYARENHMMVVPLCPFVNAQFKRHRKLYEDIWDKG